MKHLKTFEQINEELDIATRKSAYDKMRDVADDTNNPEYLMRRHQANTLKTNLSGPSEGLKKELENYLFKKFDKKSVIKVSNNSMTGEGVPNVYLDVTVAYMGYVMYKITEDSYNKLNASGSLESNLLEDRGYIIKLRTLAKSIQQNDIYVKPEEVETSDSGLETSSVQERYRSYIR